MNSLSAYVMPRPFYGFNIPMSIQSTSIRDYSSKNNLLYKLPKTENLQLNSYFIFKMMLKNSNKNINNIGVISLFVFPIEDLKLMKDIFYLHQDKNIKIHSVLENLEINIKDLIEWTFYTGNIRKLNTEYKDIIKRYSSYSK